MPEESPVFSIADLRKALDDFDGERVAELCDVLVEQLRSSPALGNPQDAATILSHLRRKRRFAEMRRVVDAFHQVGVDSPKLRRLHVQALKVAIILAALDWIELGERRQNKPVVRAAHWYRAQQMVETWRASAHRLLHDLGESEESRLETRILKLLSGQKEGLSVRSIYRALRSPRKPVMEALKALEQDGQVVGEVVQTGSRGRPSERYRLA